MEKIKREIRLFFVKYGRLLVFIIGIFLITILVLESIEDYYITTMNYEEKIEIEKQEEIEREKEQEDREYISKFIDFCNEKKAEEAYEMISYKCKQEKYTTLEEFKNEYINKFFEIRIDNYKIVKENDIYKVSLIQNMLLTGKNSIVEQIYQIEEVLEKSIYIIDEKEVIK